VIPKSSPWEPARPDPGLILVCRLPLIAIKL
jgi:hypothetical protein